MQGANHGAEVDITSYNSTSNLYTAPHDGYIVVNALKETDPIITVLITNGTAATSIAVNSRTRYLRDSLFVRKGTTCYVAVNQGTGGGSANAAIFSPLIQ